MFDDAKKELQKLEQRLLEQDDDFERFYHGVLEELDSDGDRTVPTRNRRSYGDTPRAVVKPKKKSIKGPLLIVILELIGIGALVFYWMERVF